MAFKLLNTDAVKLDSDELIKDAFDNYCSHISKGKVAASWYYKKDGKAICCYSTIERYIKKRPDVCSPTQYNCAVAHGMGDWEIVVDGAARGENKKCNPAVLQIVMRNKYGWDTTDETKELDQKIADLRALASALEADRELHAKQSEDRTD